MVKTDDNKRIFRIRDGKIEDACAFAKALLSRKDINEVTANETLLVFEALMQRLVDWGLSEDTDLEIAGVERLGVFRIRVGFEGAVFAPDDDAMQFAEDRILNDYHDKLGYSYHSGYNVISISVSRSNRTTLVACIIASLCAVAVYLPLSSLIGADVQHDLLHNYIAPLEKMYANAMLMVGAPMTLFSLLKNLTNTFIVSQRHSGIRHLQVQTLATSAFAILLAVAAFFALSVSLVPSLGASSSELGVAVDRTFADVATSLVPSNILEPFQAILPVPMMVVALLCTYALCSAGKYFDSLRYAMMACYTLFSRMLRVVIAALPFFCFLAIIEVLIDTGIKSLAVDLFAIATIYLGLLLLYATYAIRLRAHGIKVVPFLRKLVPLLHENYRIGSVINAAPYNIRYCANTFKMNRAMLERDIPVLAEINLDGNCFILMFLTLIFIFETDTHISWLTLIGLGLLVLLLSYGAPNQPGSILIGTLMVTAYLNSFEIVFMALFAEAFLGSAQNLTNVIGDIVLEAIKDRT